MGVQYYMWLYKKSKTSGCAIASCFIFETYDNFMYSVRQRFPFLSARGLTASQGNLYVVFPLLLANQSENPSSQRRESRAAVGSLIG